MKCSREPCWAIDSAPPEISLEILTGTSVPTLCTYQEIFNARVTKSNVSRLCVDALCHGAELYYFLHVIGQRTATSLAAQTVRGAKPTAGWTPSPVGLRRQPCTKSRIAKHGLDFQVRRP